MIDIIDIPFLVRQQVMILRENLRHKASVVSALERLRSHVEEPVDAEELLGPRAARAAQSGTKCVTALLAMNSDASYLHRRLRLELHLPLDDMAYFELAGQQLASYLRTYREADLCQIHWLRARSNQKEIRFVSVSQDAHRAAMSFTGEVPSLTATTRLWSYRLERVLDGKEMLKLQGFKVSKWNLDEFGEASMCRVAGSAMTVHMIAAVLVSTLSSTELPEQVVRGRRPSPSLAELRSRRGRSSYNTLICNSHIYILYIFLLLYIYISMRNN